MLLAINIENSDITTGFIEHGRIMHSFCLGADHSRTADEYALLFKAAAELGGYPFDTVGTVIIGSVMPSITSLIVGALKKISDAPVTIVGPGVRTGFSIKLDNPTELGADLAANAAGAIAHSGCPVIIADFGTATTVMVIDGDKNYVGGCIFPGVQMSFGALQTAELLPGVEAGDAVPFLGKNTRDCMRAGVIRGQTAAVEAFVQEYRQMLSRNEQIPLVITGRHAETLRPYLSLANTHIPHLTLLGLAAIDELNRRKR